MNQTWSKKYAQIVAKCWADEAFKKRFITDPAAVMQECGIEAPQEMEFKVVENSSNSTYLVLPAKADELSDEDLDTVSGGRYGCHACHIDPR